MYAARFIHSGWRMNQRAVRLGKRWNDVTSSLSLLDSTLRSLVGRHPSRQPAAGATQAVTPSASLPSSCHFASAKGKVSGTNLAGYRRFSSRGVSSACRCPVWLFVAAHGIVMSSHFTSSQATRAWHVLVIIRWQRWQSAVSGLYFHRVTAPVSFWVACGCPAAFRPALPWWQPFVFSYLSVTGWLRRKRSLFR
jgi:hypothetical protein